LGDGEAVHSAPPRGGVQPADVVSAQAGSAGPWVAGAHARHVGSRHAAGPGELTIDDLARDVLAQVPGPVNVLAGHSLGSIVAMTLVGLAPEYCDRVVVEDPPGGSSVDSYDVADSVEESVPVARADARRDRRGAIRGQHDVVQPGCGELGQEPADARRCTGCPTTEDRSVEPSGTRAELSCTGAAARCDQRHGAHRSRSVDPHESAPR
jgi:pimeloyl-ACP methyl ester carboxylesterase